jgi:hypothetical protein
MYDHMMNKYVWGGIDNPKVYLDENNLRVTAFNIRNNFARLAGALIDENKKDSAIKVLNFCDKLMPHERIPYNFFVIGLMEEYYRAGLNDKGNKIAQKLFDVTVEDISFYLSQKDVYYASVDPETKRALGVLSELARITKQHNQTDLSKKFDESFKKFYDMYMTKGPTAFEDD